MALLCVGVGISPTSWGVNGLQGRGSSHDLLSGAESPKEWSGGLVTLKETRKGKKENSKYGKNLLIEVYLKQYWISI